MLPRANGIPGVLITQALNGSRSTPYTTTLGNPLDNDNSTINTGSVFASFEDGRRTRSERYSNDKIVLGYTAEGLPFQIVVGGVEESKAEATFKFIDNYVTPLINRYAERFSTNTFLSASITNEMIVEIFDLRDKHAPDCEFTMSLGITYSSNNILRCAGFGVGNTGLVMVNEKKEVTQLAYSTNIDGAAVGFNRANANDISQTILRNSKFNVQVNPGDELFGYTYLTDALHHDTKNYDEVDGAVTRRVTINRLAHEKIQKDRALFDAVQHENFALFGAQCEKARNASETTEFGNTYMFGSINVPNPELQNKLQEQAYKDELARLNKLIENEDPVIKNKALAIVKTIETMKADPNQSLPELTSHLAACNRAIMDRNNPAAMSALQIRATNLAEKNQSACAEMLAAGLLGLGIALIVIGSIFIGCGAISIPAVPISLPMIFAGAGILGAGLLITAAASTMFAINHRASGIAKDMQNLHTEVEKSLPQRLSPNIN